MLTDVKGVILVLTSWLPRKTEYLSLLRNIFYDVINFVTVFNQGKLSLKKINIKNTFYISQQQIRLVMSRADLKCH